MSSPFLKDFLKYIPSRVVPGAFGILVLPVLTRLFDPSDYGQYTIVISTIAVLSIVATDWISPSIVRFYTEYEAKGSLKTFYSTVFLITAGSMAAVLAVALAATYAAKSSLSPTFFRYLQVGWLLLAVGIAYNVMTQMLIVRREIRAFTFYQVWRQVACVLLGIGLAYFFRWGVSGLLWGAIAGILLATPVLFPRAFRELSLSGYSVELRSKIMSYGFPLIATNLAFWALTLSDRYIIEYFRGSHEVGLYSVSYVLADRTILLVSALIVQASGPIVMEIWEKQGERETREFLEEVCRYQLILLIPIAVGLGLLAEPIVALLAAGEYREGYKVIPMVAAGGMLFGIQRNFQVSLLVLKKTRVIMYIVAVSGLANVLLNLLLVPRYGFVAAGVSTLLSYAIFTAAMIVVSRRYLAWEFPFGTLKNVLASVSVMAVAVYLGMKIRVGPDWLRIAFATVLGSVVHFGVMLYTREIDGVKIRRLFAVKSG